MRDEVKDKKTSRDEVKKTRKLKRCCKGQEK